MRYADFEYIMSPKRMERYLKACRGRKRKAMMLYNHNLRLAKEVYVLVNYFEVALRNAIDREMISRFGEDWLRDAVIPGGILRLFYFMGIDSNNLLKNIDNLEEVCKEMEENYT